MDKTYGEALADLLEDAEEVVTDEGIVLYVTTKRKATALALEFMIDED